LPYSRLTAADSLAPHKLAGPISAPAAFAAWSEEVKWVWVGGTAVI